MLNTFEFGNALKTKGFTFFSGVPCSWLKNLINYAINECSYIISANEGDAVACCAGAAIGGKKSVVLMQNSGLTNAVSPLTSLTNIFHIPVLGFVSLRGDAAFPDEPQHELTGVITTALLDLLQIPWLYLSSDPNEALSQLKVADEYITSDKTFFFVVRKGTFSEVKLKSQEIRKLQPLTTTLSEINTEKPLRKMVLKTINELKQKETLLLATTGKTGRELFETEDAPNNLYMVGSMGCLLSLGLGLALAQPDKKVVAIDGDGALIMRLGSLTTAGYYRPNNLLHILLDNQSHDSTGGQATLSAHVDFPAFAAAAGYPMVVQAFGINDLKKLYLEWYSKPQLTFLYLKTARDNNPEPGRPGLKPWQVKERFINFINE